MGTRTGAREAIDTINGLNKEATLTARQAAIPTKVKPLMANRKVKHRMVNRKLNRPTASRKLRRRTVNSPAQADTISKLPTPTRSMTSVRRNKEPATEATVSLDTGIDA